MLVEMHLAKGWNKFNKNLMENDRTAKNNFSLSPQPGANQRLSENRSFASTPHSFGRYNSDRQPPRTTLFSAEGRREIEFERSNSELARENKQLRTTNLKLQREKEVLQETNAELQKRESSHLAEIHRMQGETDRLHNQIDSLYERMLKQQKKEGGKQSCLKWATICGSDH